MSDDRHIRSLVLKNKKGKEITLETDLFNYEIAKQFKGWIIDRERDIKGTKRKEKEENDDDL